MIRTSEDIQRYINAQRDNPEAVVFSGPLISTFRALAQGLGMEIHPREKPESTELEMAGAFSTLKLNLFSTIGGSLTRQKLDDMARAALSRDGDPINLEFRERVLWAFNRSIEFSRQAKL